MASPVGQTITFVMGVPEVDPPPELRGFDNRVVRRKARGTVGGPWYCSDKWVVPAYPTNGCTHLRLEHDRDGCMWAKCSCERKAPQ